MPAINRIVRLYTAGIFTLGITMSASTAIAAVIDAVVGGAPSGSANVYENFDFLPAAGGTTANGITVTFGGTDAGVAKFPNLEGKYVAPFISNSNGTLFGNSQVSGYNETQYLTTGIGSVTLELGDYHRYFGLLWGSVDSHNVLSFYDGNTLLFSFTGLDVNALADGNQGAEGTFYVNINSDIAFNKVIATSGQYGFEFDNVALIRQPLEFPAEVPVPGTLLLLGIGLLINGVIRQFVLRSKTYTSIHEVIAGVQ